MEYIKQATIGTILEEIKILKSKGMTDEQINKIPVYISDDEELNGIHTAWFVDVLDRAEKNAQYYIDMIEEDNTNLPMTYPKAILIS